MLEGLEWIGGYRGDGGDWFGRRGLEGILTRSSFRSLADLPLGPDINIQGINSKIYNIITCRAPKQ
jgi:hypothetical protein